MSKRLKIATIGGGSSYTPEIVEGFIRRAAELPVGELWLVDVPEGQAKLEIVGALARRMVARAGLDMTVVTTLDRRAALAGADFVTTQFRVGQLEARARDERIPLRYGVIGQETTGPGGFAKALRTIPVIMEICRDMAELCPEAWLINFTNPTGILTEAILNHTQIKTIGLCNVPIGMKMGIARLLDVATERVQIDFAGLNHLVYGLNVYLDGVSVTREVINTLADGGSLTMRNIKDLAWEPEFIRSLGLLPCPYHRYFYQTDAMLAEEMEAARAHGTRAEVVKRVEAELFELYKDPALAVKPPQLEKRGGAYYSDAACNLISSLWNNKGDVQTVNVRNNGTIADLPNHVAVEVNAVISRAGARPIQVGHLPVQARGLVQVVKAYEELTVAAALSGDYGTALQALVMNPLVPSAAVAKRILDDILAENRAHLPQFA
ncbi:MAG: 6-phospho-beta-glucosidase [Symbiobacteriaceae bacterium]|jgi:6-phospho-beta-glucosidase|nr:6-phospho-beta-glucosidase [Symbiobacteriaceae bacterium]